MNVFWLLLLTGVLAALQMLLFKRAGLRGIRVERRFTRGRVFEGESLQMIETIENRRLLPVPWLRIETRMPTELLFGRQENLEIGGQRYHRSVFFLGSWQRVRRTHQVRAMRRGYYALSSYAMTVGDLLGVSQVSVERPMRCALTVYPRLLSRDEVRLPVSRWQGEAVVRRFIDPDLFLYSGIRDYRPGDLPRDVHWRASARTGRLEVKQHDYTAQSRLVVLLNVVARENQWDAADERDSAVVEQGIRLAATLMCYALQDGLEVGFGSNGYAKPVEGETVYVAPAGGRQQSEILLETCARLAIRRVLPFHVFLGNLRLPQDADVVLISGYDSELIRAEMARLRARGLGVTLLPIEKEAA